MLCAARCHDGKTVTDWYNFFRDVCSADMVANPVQISGPGTTVAIDESAVAKAKPGNIHTPQQWVFGGLQLGTNRFFIELVPQCNAATLQWQYSTIRFPATICGRSPASHSSVESRASHLTVTLTSSSLMLLVESTQFTQQTLSASIYFCCCSCYLAYLCCRLSSCTRRLLTCCKISRVIDWLRPPSHRTFAISAEFVLAAEKKFG